MIVRGIDGTGDWLFGKGANDYKSGSDAVAQSIKTRLGMLRGDCFFAKNDGIDWLNLLGSKDQTALSLAINAEILNTPGVLTTTQLSVNLDGSRRLTVSYSVNTVYTGTFSTAPAVAAATISYLLDESGNFLLTEDGNKIEEE